MPADRGEKSQDKARLYQPYRASRLGVRQYGEVLRELEETRTNERQHVQMLAEMIGRTTKQVDYQPQQGSSAREYDNPWMASTSHDAAESLCEEPLDAVDRQRKRTLEDTEDGDNIVHDME
ncbi:hypothetical protein Q1695_016461 [Nippostrongylus brasiliensis]|nr:hypothetical protein Q1695_016461 [Nippostrongylus brasiliensis]